MKKIFTLVATALVFLCFSASLKAQQTYLKFAGINGSSTTTYAPGLIEVASFGNSTACTSCAVVTGGTGAGTGKVSAGKIVFNLNNSADAVSLKALLFNSKTSQNACFAFTKAVGGKPAAYYYVILSNVTVIEVDETNAGGGATSTLQVSLGYSAITYTFKPQSATGGFGQPVSTGWDFAKNIVTILPVPSGL